MLEKQDSFSLSYFIKSLGTLNKEILQMKKMQRNIKLNESKAFSKDSSYLCFLMTLLLNVKYSFLWVHWATGFNRNQC